MFLCVWVVLQALDWGTTYMADGQGILEKNPLMYIVIASYGFVGLACVKMVGIFIYGVCCYVTLRENYLEKVFYIMSLSIFVFYIIVVIGNILTVWQTIH